MVLLGGEAGEFPVASDEQLRQSSAAMADTWLVVVLVAGVIFGSTCRSIALSKGRSGIDWFVLGFVSGLIALFFVYVLPPLPHTRVDASSSDGPPEGWYPDPDGHGLRWWDGSCWTGATKEDA